MMGGDEQRDGTGAHGTPPPADDRTIFNPSPMVPPPPPGLTTSPPAPQPATWGAADPASAPALPPDLTPASSGWGDAGGSLPPAPPAAPPAGPDPQTAFPAAAAPPSSARPIQVGDVLNHIFEVKRFIARGGMGEVFEGANVNSDERVAIKVMLAGLAADPNVQAMFRKEARTLTRLSHPALVQYRVLAQEPTLGVFYIVTEYIDGQNLSDVLRDQQASAADLMALTRRLAGGLQAAHALGAIHRDISPDNVMLEDGLLARAKIIDFGIAKDLDPGTATIVGDGFAGKLNYVAPEQLGDFGREVGPWTDVYSLGLVILAVAMRRDVNMGGSLVDAVDKRRAGPDLSPVPVELRDVLAAMLRPNPAERLRSMEDVMAALAAIGTTPAPAQPAAPPRAKPPKPPTDQKSGANRKPLLIGGGVLAAMLAAGGLYLAMGGDDDPADVAATDRPVAAAPATPADPVAAARAALDRGLAGVACTWLDVDRVEQVDGTLAVALRGVAGKPAEAQASVARLVEAAGVPSVAIDFNDVAPIQASECTPLEAFRQVRAAGGQRVTVAQRQFEMSTLGADVGPDAGKLGAAVVMDFDLAGLADDVTLVGFEQTGATTQLLTTRADFDSDGIERLPNDRRRIQVATTHKGWSGVLLLTGRGPFPANLFNLPAGSKDDAWKARFLAEARDRGWASEMVWYKTVDAVPN